LLNDADSSIDLFESALIVRPVGNRIDSDTDSHPPSVIRDANGAIDLGGQTVSLLTVQARFPSTVSSTTKRPQAKIEKTLHRLIDVPCSMAHVKYVAEIDLALNQKYSACGIRIAS